MLFIDSWLIGGPLGQALCKLVTFLADTSALVSVQSLVLIAMDRFGAVVYPLRYPLISSKLCPFFILATWIVAMAVLSPYLFAMKMLEYGGRLECRMHWNEVELRGNFGHIHRHPVCSDSHTLHHHLFKAQVAEDSWRAIGQR